MKTLLFAVPALCFAAACQAAPQAVPPQIKSFVREKGKTRDGIGRLSKLVRADLDGDGDQDAVIQFSVDDKNGGNFSQSFIAAFINKKRVFAFAGEISAGSFGTATGEQLALLRAAKGHIVCARYVYQEGDGVCCPSPAGSVSLRLQGGKLRRVKR